MIKTKLNCDNTKLLKWITEQVNLNPYGRINQYSKKRRIIGAQYTVFENDITKPFFDIMRVYGEPTDVWVNYNPPNAKNIKHNHVGGDLAGCWYLVVPENSGMIVFETGEEIQPVEYDFFVWDAKTYHWVTTNLSKETRISIAFNLRRK